MIFTHFLTDYQESKPIKWKISLSILHYLCHSIDRTSLNILKLSIVTNVGIYHFKSQHWGMPWEVKLLGSSFFMISYYFLFVFCFWSVVTPTDIYIFNI